MISSSLAEAFLAQAQADYSTFELVREKAENPPSQWLHLLQMSVEKTGKAYLAAEGKGFDELKQSHLGFSKVLKLLPRNPAVQSLLEMPRAAVRSHVNALRPLASEVERLVPGKDNSGRNAEYPWKDPQGKFVVPAAHDFSELSNQLVRQQRGRQLLKLLRILLKEAKCHAAFGILRP